MEKTSIFLMGPKYPQKTGDAVKIFGTLLIIKMNLRNSDQQDMPRLEHIP